MFVKARGFRSRYGIITYYRKPKSDRKSESLSRSFHSAGSSVRASRSHGTWQAREGVPDKAQRPELA